MKKENRKMAQQRRAQERRQKALRKKVSSVLAVLIPLLAFAALITVFIIFSAPDSSDSTGTNGTEATDSTSDTNGSETGSGTDSDSADSAYSSDTSLTVENGDTVNIDYVGSVDGVEFSGGNTYGAGTDLVIGSGSYIDDFEDQLIGAHPGDTVEVNVTFPDNYKNEDLSGKDAVFEVVVNGIYE